MRGGGVLPTSKAPGKPRLVSTSNAPRPGNGHERPVRFKNDQSGRILAGTLLQVSASSLPQAFCMGHFAFPLSIEMKVCKYGRVRCHWLCIIVFVPCALFGG
jgi:hypothetical protein